MNLESAVKYHFAKSTSISDSPRATSPDTLTGTDVMGAIGYCQSKESFGFSAFSGKMEISQNDKVKAIQLLTQYALKHCDKVAALRKLDRNVKAKVMQILAKFAYADYCRSAASVEDCICCRGSGFKAGKLCAKCNGKGIVSCACRDCHGRGTAVDREETERQAVPVRKTCKRCSGRGYERIPAAKVFRVVVAIGDITLDQWKRGCSQFYYKLIIKCEKGETEADNALKSVTR